MTIGSVQRAGSKHAGCTLNTLSELLGPAQYSNALLLRRLPNQCWALVCHVCAFHERASAFLLFVGLCALVEEGKHDAPHLPPTSWRITTSRKTKQIFHILSSASAFTYILSSFLFVQKIIRHCAFEHCFIDSVDWGCLFKEHDF